ncbi:transmembrane and ubiquitin-like domain-containing protein 2 [Anneissia japonica]|uniref:transmembrane and ubiquitin-like domain-containing protein 2 n=1 Tax=Anneissia japonica TaxID=1529436 RepID=UPI0014257B97|nr:transmembrane and ubiquitin-like domain-containing protein 2 [Anneissia japonica]
MPLIEGIGDEVTIVISILMLVITMAVAWISTLVRDRPATSLTFTRNEYLDQELIQEDELPEEVYNSNITRHEIENIVADTNQGVENTGEETVSTDSNEDDTSNESLTNGAQIINDASEDSTMQCLATNDIENNQSEIKDQSDTFVKKEDNDKEKSKNETVCSENNEGDKRDEASNPSQNVEELSSSEQTDSTSQEHNSSTTNVDVIRIRLKFLNESERTVNVNPNVTLLQFKRDTFVEETSQGFTLRLILNGHLLQDDQRTLAQLNINNNCVIHCQLLQADSITNTAPNVINSELDIGQVMIPMFAVLLGLVWYVRLEYRHLFNATSTLSLLGVSVLFLLAVLASWRS